MGSISFFFFFFLEGITSFLFNRMWQVNEGLAVSSVTVYEPLKANLKPGCPVRAIGSTLCNTRIDWIGGFHLHHSHSKESHLMFTAY